MFGDCFVYRKQPKVLLAGDYTVTLMRPFITTVGGYKVLRFPFKVDGETEEVVPCYFDLFDVPNPRDTKQVERFCKTASRIKDCFKLEGDFSELSYLKWEGKRGKIHVSMSDNGFMNVTKFYPAPKDEQKEMFTPQDEAPVF